MKTFNEMFKETVTQFSGWQNALASNKMLKTAVDLLKKLEEIVPNSENLIVGGAVRDLLLGQEPHDIDIGTNIDIDTIEKHFHTDEIGKSKDFGITNVHYGDETFEVANFREEEGYSDFRRPDSVKMVKSFEKDATRRDLTINALGIDKNGYIHDYVGGIDDLRNKIIRTVGEPFKRFTEDALRLLRVGRFASKLGFKIDPQTETAISELKSLIEKVVPERIKGELYKAAENGGPVLADYLEHLYKTGLLNIIIPELAGLSGLLHKQEHHPEAPDVLGHVLAALRASKSKDPTVNLAIAFHDVGKLTTGDKDEEGEPTYHGHDDAGVDVFNAIANRLKLSNEERDAILFAISYHMKGHKLPEMKKSKVLAMRQNPNWPVLKDVIYADAAARGPKFKHQTFNKDMEYVEDILSKFGEKDAFEKKMATFVDGRLIMRLVDGIKGADIGKIKNDARDLIVSKDFNITQDEINNYIVQKARELGYKV
jgi:tRNA nucleotidyltransferase/poly(A) polymerase